MAIAVEFDKKIALLCSLARIDTPKLLSDLISLKKMRRSIIVKWTKKDSSPDIRQNYRNLFIEYWHENYQNIDFSYDCYSMPFIDFERHISRQQSEARPAAPPVTPSPQPPTDRADRLVGIYQTIRPHTTLPNQYILEPFEISSEYGTLFNYMFSHNAPNAERIYKGEINIADRYYFSLLKRFEPDNHAHTAFRSISFYVGSGFLERCLSGLMLRGVTGHGPGGTQAVAVPFVALRVPEDGSIRNPSLVELRENEGLYRLSENSSLLLGEINAHPFEELFRTCESIFSSIKQSGLTNENHPVVLRTIIPASLRHIGELNYNVWRRRIKQYFSTRKCGRNQE